MKIKTNSILDKHIDKLRKEIEDREKEIAIIKEITEKCRIFNEENKDFNTSQNVEDVFKITLNVISNLQSKIEANNKDVSVLKSSISNLSALNNNSIKAAIESLNLEVAQKEAENTVISDKIVGISQPLASLMDFNIECPFCTTTTHLNCSYCGGSRIVKFGQAYNNNINTNAAVANNANTYTPKYKETEMEYEPIVKTNYHPPQPPKMAQQPAPVANDNFVDKDLQSILFGDTKKAKPAPAQTKEGRVGHTKFILENEK